MQMWLPRATVAQSKRCRKWSSESRLRNKGLIEPYARDVEATHL